MGGEQNLIIISLFWLKFPQSKGRTIIEEKFPLENTKSPVLLPFSDKQQGLEILWVNKKLKKKKEW